MTCPLPPALAAANLASADRSLLVEVLRAAEEITGCPDQAIELVRDYSIPLFDGLTARELVGAGRGPAVLAYLENRAAGATG